MKGKKRPVARNRERIDYDPILRKLLELLWVYRGMIRITILKNIGLITYALITLFSGARGGNGWLSKAALARCLPLGMAVSYTHLRAHETDSYLVCRLLLEKK